MKPPPFRYARPATIEEALDALAQPGAAALAGGQSLLVALNLRRARPACLVDLAAIEELARGDVDASGDLRLGAMVTLAHAELDPGIRAAAPLLAQALALVGNPQVRARGTLGGSVAQRDPVGEVLTALVALGASAIVRGPAGERSVPVASLEIGRGELLTALAVPVAAGALSAFGEVAPRHAARALAGAAALVGVDGDGLLTGVRIAVAGVAAAPALLGGLEELRGERPSSPAVDAAISAAVARLVAAADMRADERYRRECAAALAARAVRDAVEHGEPAVAPARIGAPRAAAVAARRAGPEGTRTISLTVNGAAVTASAEPRLLLSDLLRGDLGLHGPHIGCEHGVCGACNVLLDGRAVRSCLMLAVQAECRAVQTLEGLLDAGALETLGDAFVDGHALQCGFCTPGFLVTLAQPPRAPGEPVRAVDLAGNLCRCTGYAPIVAAARGEATDHGDPRAIVRLGARRLVSGGGRFVDDVDAPGTLHAAFVRSPLAHALIRRIDLDRARRAPGVLAAFAAADLERLGARELPVGWTVPGQRPGATPLLASGRARYAGEALAVVVAESRYLAEDACELAELDLEPLPVVLDVELALAPDAPLLHPEWGDNVLARAVFEGGDADAAFARADVVVGGRFEIARQTGLPIEPRGALARVDAASGEIVVVSSAQSPHHSAEALAHALGVDQKRVRVIAPDVGGSFGIKDHACVEEAVIALAAVAIGRPVRWNQDRRENLIAGVHSRGQRYDVELAAERSGRILAVRGRLMHDAGARSGNHGAGTAVYSSLMLPGPYAFGDYRLEMTALVTNKPPSAAYRGYGAPEAAFVMEGLIDALAQELGVSGAELRRRNLIPAHRFPFRSATGLDYDTGDPAAAMERALVLARDAPPPRPGRLRGIGIAAFVLMGGFGPTRAALDAGMTFGGYESARVRMDRDANVTVAVGMPSQGQGVETALAQVAASVLGVDPRRSVLLDSSDSARVPYSPVGAIASRGAAVGGSAVHAASRRLAAQLRRMAAAMLEVAAETVELRDGHAVAVAGDRGRVPLSAVAAAIQRGELSLEDGETALEASATVDPVSETFSGGVHVAVVDVDPDCGAVAVIRYAAVSDCGRLINPAIVRGQIEGAIAQGIGGALMEELTYAPDGTPTATTLFEYTIPTAADMPSLAIEMLETPAPLTATGARGAGELGIIGPGAAIAGAVTDAIGGAAPVRRLPMTAPYVRELARLASTRREPAPAPPRDA